MILPFLSTLLIAPVAAAEPVVEPASHTQQPINAIREIFYQIPAVDAARAALGLEPVINLSIGQPHVPMQVRVLDSFIQYLQGLKDLPSEDFCVEMGYSHSAGLPETRKRISQFFTESFPEVPGGFLPEEVMVTNGATGALTNALNVLVQEGDEVAVFAPYFAAYENQVKNCGSVLVPIPLVPERSSGDLLASCLDSHPKIKAFIWNDPNNPLGTKADEEELRQLAAVIAKHPNLIVIHDEVYKDIIHHGSTVSLMNVAPEMKSRSFIIRSLAKDILGAPAIRAGMIAAPTNMQTHNGKRVNWIELMSNEQLRDITAVSILVQKVLVFSLEQKLSGMSKQWEDDVRSEYAKNTEIVVEALTKLGFRPLAMPKGAFYVMVDVSSLIGKKMPKKISSINHLEADVPRMIQNDVDIATFFLHTAGVAVVPSVGFGIDRCAVRVSCARPKSQLLQAMERMKQAVQSL